MTAPSPMLVAAAVLALMPQAEGWAWLPLALWCAS